MYNAKIIKYPAGYQVRIYSQPVGVCLEPEPEPWTDADYMKVLVQEDDEQCLYSVPVSFWQNPFSEEWEAPPTILTEHSRDRSIQVSLARTVNKVYDIARSNLWEWFFTLTFDPQKVDSFDYGECTKKLSKWLNNMRTASPDMMYLVVPEKHKSGRYHFHGIFGGCENIEFVDSGKRQGADVIYNVGSYRLGHSTATKVKSNEKVVKYITKYITKELCDSAFGKRRYWASRNVKTADSVEMLLDAGQLAEFREQMREHVKYQKRMDSESMRTEYYELDLVQGAESLGYIAL